ncbi:hypothetical protein CSB20_05755 [bacterium DOLZORAL124_64_63]|nr:MAG: hypothetical protein CSB20_05755 [bacterium DOLZORAL124_64_63]
MAIVEYGSANFSQQANLEKYSRPRVLVVNPSQVWRERSNPAAIATMKELNPDLKVLGYFNAHSSWLRWGNDHYPDGSYESDWYDATRPYWSYTTEGDTMMSWPGKALINILNPDCREAMVQVLRNHWEAHDNVFDGIFWDHFNTKLWVINELEGREGDMDLDGDGISHKNDEDEMEAYRQASVALITRAREVLGEDVIQITNGNRAAVDEEFAGLVDGAFYEHFPEVGFSGDEMRNALDPACPNNLFTARSWMRTRNGGPFLILSNTHFVYREDAQGHREAVRLAEFNRAVALITGNLVSYHSDDCRTHYGWPDQEVNLGRPLGEAQFEGDFVSREFENGRVWLDFSEARLGAPFSFQIQQNGMIIQDMDLMAD